MILTRSIFRKKPGLPPGSLVYTRDPVQDYVSIQLVQYTEEDVSSSEESSVDAMLKKLDKNKVNWININGLHNVSVIESIGKHFDIHPLVLEDILHTEHMPKLDHHDNYVFLTLKMLRHDNKQGISQEHVSMLLGNHYLITFQEKDGDVFDAIREGLNNGTGRLRRRKADYLFYRLLDTIVDHYYLLTDALEDNLEELEELLLEQRLDGISEQLLTGKKKMIFLRRNIIPLREEMRKLKQEDILLIEENTMSFFGDVFDHLMHLSNTLEGLRDLITSLMELQMAANSNRMNIVMKTLTIFAAIFMPLTFIAGVYGMNFHRMPELEWHWGYPVVLLAMVLVAGSMVFYMKFKKWL